MEGQGGIKLDAVNVAVANKKSFRIGDTVFTLGGRVEGAIGVGIEGRGVFSITEKPGGGTKTRIGAGIFGGLGARLGLGFELGIETGHKDGSGGRQTKGPGGNGFGSVDGSQGTVQNPEIARGGQKNATSVEDDDDSSSTQEDRDSRDNATGKTDDPNSGDKEDADRSGADHDAPGDQPGDGPE